MEIDDTNIIRLAQKKIKTRLLPTVEIMCDICKSPIVIGQKYHDGTKHFARGHIECVQECLNKYDIKEVPPVGVKKEKEVPAKVKIIDGVIMYQLCVFSVTSERIDSRFGYNMKYEDYIKEEAKYLSSLGRKTFIEYRQYNKEQGCALFVDDIAEDWRWVKP